MKINERLSLVDFTWLWLVLGMQWLCLQASLWSITVSHYSFPLSEITSVCSHTACTSSLFLILHC